MYRYAIFADYMKNKIFITLVLLLINNSIIQAQGAINLDFLPQTKTENGINFSKSVFSDSLVSSSVICINKEVKLHKHLEHAEHVLVLEGEGEMRLGTEVFVIKKNDLIFIPKNTPHAVKTISAIPLKVLSIQAPLFDGKDRVMLE